MKEKLLPHWYIFAPVVAELSVEYLDYIIDLIMVMIKTDTGLT